MLYIIVAARLRGNGIEFRIFCQFGIYYQTVAERLQPSIYTLRHDNGNLKGFRYALIH
jgi:hypothetical protein